MTYWIVCAGCLCALDVSSGLGKTLYVDGSIWRSCKGSYSIGKRNTWGSDGDAYKTIVEAANVAQAGDTVFIRGGVYHTEKGAQENDVLWPKNSGEPGKPILFKAYNKEEVILGGGSSQYPDSQESLPRLSSPRSGMRRFMYALAMRVANPSSLMGNNSNVSIARCVVVLKGVHHIAIEDLSFKKVAGWVFARNSNHITFRNCAFEDAEGNFKGTVRFIECQDCRLFACSFKNSGGDSLTLEKCDRTLVENCTFRSATHALLAMRASSYTVLRHCTFNNPYFVKEAAEKLLEVYDFKLDWRNPDNPAYAAPAYNSAKRNLFEYNLFGYHPFRPNTAAQPSAIQYSGQEGIIRRNVFSNPPLKKPDPDYPAGVAGGMGLQMRYGGSWEGWHVKTDGRGVWLGEATEAGFVTHNRVYNNTFFGYDQGCITIPEGDGMNGVINPPPMNEANPPQQFGEKFAFRDNVFINNIMVPGRYQFHTDFQWQQWISGKPIAVIVRGLMDEVHFQNNNLYADGDKGAMVYVKQDTGRTPSNLISWGDARYEERYPRMFSHNLRKDPLFVGSEANDFHLKESSPMIDTGAFLTRTTGAGVDSTEMRVQDPMFFYDGFGIEGEKGDLIQLSGQKETARVVHIDYQKKALTLDHPLSWKDGQEVTLSYSGDGPDIGAYEMSQQIVIGSDSGESRDQQSNRQ